MKNNFSKNNFNFINILLLRFRVHFNININ